MNQEISGQSFRSNPNKDYLRAVFDKEIVGRWRTEVGRPLRYLGLPGPQMLDIVEWQHHLESFTTIERSEDEQHRMFLSANVRDVEHRLFSLYGEFDKILLGGRDAYGRTPQWPYHLVNLDFFGGFLYADLSRPRALEKLIENQGHYGQSFLLILTYHLREVDTAQEKQSFLNDLEKLLAQVSSGRRGLVREATAWYRSSSTPDAARQALYVNMFLRDQGESARFRVHCRPAIVYGGTGGARMIHFVSEFRYQGGSHKAVSDQSLAQVVSLGYRELIGEELVERVAVPVVALDD